jgi:hypothetical protein
LISTEKAVTVMSGYRNENPWVLDGSVNCEEERLARKEWCVERNQRDNTQVFTPALRECRDDSLL